MIRWLVSFCVFLLALLGTWLAWDSLREAEISNVATIIETEAQSDRRELVRGVDRVIDALERTRRFWERFGGLPQDQWDQDAGIELSHFEGLKAIVWFADGGETRYLRSDDHPVLSYRPDDDEFEAYREYVDQLGGYSGLETSEVVERDGSTELVVYMPSSDSEIEGGLVALMDPAKLAEHVLRDASPGYAIQVTDVSSELVLYEFQSMPARPIEDWLISDEIQVFDDHRWRVTHTPTQETMDIVRSGSSVMIAGLGLMVAVLLGTLTFEYAGALVRARAAESDSQTLTIANKDLERVVAKRTLEVRRRAQDLQTLTDSVAHDMRNPLNAVGMTLQLLDRRLDKAGNDRDRALIERMRPSLGQMEEILDRLVGLSTVTHRIFERELVDLKARAEALFEGLVAAEPAPPVELEIHDLPPANADGVLVDVLLTNLISNAIKYTREKSERRIVIDAVPGSSPTVYRVADTGIGFDRDSAGKMFDAFERLEADDDTEGLGLGLTIVLRIIQRHKGRIRAEGVPGEGAVFSFSLEPDQSGGDDHNPDRA